MSDRPQRPAGGSTRGPFVRPSVAHHANRRVTISLGNLQSEYARRTLGAFIPITIVNAGGHNTRRVGRVGLARDGVRCERADGRFTHRVLT